MKNKWKCFGGSLLITLSFVFFIGVVSSIAMMIMKDALNYVTLISGVTQLLYLLLVIIILKLRKIDIKSRCGLCLVPYKEYIIPALMAFCFSAFSNIAQTVLPIPEELMGGMSDEMGNSVIVFVTAIFIVAPIVEEMVFRGLIMTKLRKEISALGAILVSALLFAIIHFMAGGIITVIHAFLGGLIFALTYEKTKSLLPTIVAHVFGNLGGIIVSVTNGCSIGGQYILAVIFMVATLLLCVNLIRKKEI